MRMIPPYLSSETKSGAERRLFSELEKVDLSGKPVCLHSLNLPEHIYKSSGELDFVVVSKSGVYILEVKGGGITSREGIWYYQDRWGIKHRSSEGPFDQAKSGMYSMLKILREEFRIPALDQATVGYGVVFPDCDFSIHGLEWDQDIILDAGRLREEGLQTYLKQLSDYWHAKFPAKPETISPTLVGKIVQALRPDFELVVSLEVQNEEIEARLERLTVEQYHRLDIIQHCPRILIEGGAGTGKTFLAAEIARRHAAEGKKTLFVCYSPILANYLRKKIDSRLVTVHPVHRLMVDLVKKYGSVPAGYVPGLPVTDPWFVKQLAPAFERTARSMSEEAKYEVLILDEGQDIINLEYMTALDAILRGGLEHGTWRIFYDPFKQSAIYDAMDTDTLDLLRSYGPVPPRLVVNCRNTDPIVLQTRLMTGADFSEKSTGPGPDVTIRFYSDLNDAARKMEGFLDDLEAKRVDMGSITILSPREYAESAADRLNRKWRSQIKVLKGSVEETFPHSSLTFSTIADFKGLENRYVLLIDIDDLDSTPRSMSVLYVGMTRARVQLWLAMDEDLRNHHEEISIRNLQHLMQRENNEG